MSTYTTYETEFGQLFVTRQDEDGRIYTFPADESNSDYQRYLEEQANDQSL